MGVSFILLTIILTLEELFTEIACGTESSLSVCSTILRCPWTDCISLESLLCAWFALILFDAESLSCFGSGSCLIPQSSVAISSYLRIVRFVDKLCQREVVKNV